MKIDDPILWFLADLVVLSAGFFGPEHPITLFLLAVFIAYCNWTNPA